MLKTGETTPSDRDRLIWDVVRRCKIGGVEPQNSLLTLQESELLKELLIYDFTKTTNNLRVRRLMGLGHRPMTESIPSKPRISPFSCARYQFFLDAPFEISHQCCHVMKKEPLDRYGKQMKRVPITAQMASESKLRTQVWLQHGCNMFDSKKAISNPMSFWTEQDVLLYIYRNRIPICSVYGDVVKETEVEGQLDFEDLGIFDLGIPVLTTTGCKRTGCMLCGFGCQLPWENRFEQLKKTHPKMYAMLDVVKNNGITMREAIDWVNEHGNLHIRY